jgi:hypothetical protein
MHCAKRKPPAAQRRWIAERKNLFTIAPKLRDAVARHEPDVIGVVGYE